MKNFEQHCSVTQVIDPATITSDTDGDSVSMAGYDCCTFLALVGESGDTLSGSLYIELEVEDSDDDSDFSDAADADVKNYVAGTNDGCFAKIDAAAEDDAVYKCTYRGSAAYVRPVINVTGTHSSGTPIGIIAIRHAKHGIAPGS
jgi:hypothetical protein